MGSTKSKRKKQGKRLIVTKWTLFFLLPIGTRVCIIPLRRLLQMNDFLNLYPTTELEDWVSNLYINKVKILRPSEIDELNIASYYGIFLSKRYISPSHLILGRYIGITVDKRDSPEVQREDFFHELCHVLRHSGIQTMMPNAFRELQEWDARNFVRYAAIPHHMLRFIDFNDTNVINNMSEMFKVTPELCEERLNYIKRRIALYGKELIRK